MLIRAYARLANKTAIPDLVMAGDPEHPFAVACRQLAASLGVEAKVRFAGHLPQEQLIPLYRRALFTVVPSICFENMPNVVLESFAGVTPVIGSNLGSIRELIRDGENGFLFEAGNDASLAQAMEKALEPGWAADAGELARRFMRNNLAQDLHMRRLLALFESVRAGRPSPS